MKMRAYITAFHAAILATLLAASAVGAGTMTLLGAGKAPTAAGGGGCSGSWTGPTSGLTHCWMMDNAHVSGTTIQDSVGSINGTAGANVTAGTGPSGSANTARTYDGTTQPILLASDPTPGSQPVTFATWINLATGVGNDGDPRWVCFQAAGSQEVLFANQNVNPPGYVDMAMASFGGAETSNQSLTVTTPAWHHAAMTYDGVSLLFYWDGTLTSTPNVAVGDGCDANTWALGGRNAANRLWAGSQSTTVVYSRALSGAEITTLKNAF